MNKSLPLFLLFLSCNNKTDEIRFFALSTYVQVKTDSKIPESLIKHEIERIDRKFNVFDSTSLISHLNKDRILIDSEFAAVIKKASQISKNTAGHFTVFIYPLEAIWGFYSDSFKMPEANKINIARAKVLEGSLYVKKDTIRLIRGKIDLGAIAKGYAVDRIAKLLYKQGARNILVNIGGDIYVKGAKNWHIGIKNPREQGIIKVLKVKNVAVVTSGDYERYFFYKENDKDSIRYHHIINPFTGYPGRACVSITVLSYSCMIADAYATGFMAMDDKEKILEVAKKLHIKTIIIDKDLNIEETYE